MIHDLKGKTVLVTGATGFLGSHCVVALREIGARVVAVGGRRSSLAGRSFSWSDLEDRDDVNGLIYRHEPDFVLHLAGYNGGILLNQREPATIFYRNTLMGLNVLEACVANKVKKVVSVVASCGYPEGPVNVNGMPRNRGVLREEDFLEGPPHHSVAGHAYAKRNLFLAADFYRAQHGLNAVTVCPTTLYGPGDSYDPERTKVMGAMVKRFADAADDGVEEVTCWGSGKPLREFLYAPDCARLLVRVLTNYDDPGLLNLGTGQERTVSDLAELVALEAGFKGMVIWDRSKPSGQRRKRLDLTRMERALPGFVPTTLQDGIRTTITAYRASRSAAEAAA